MVFFGKIVLPIFLIIGAIYLIMIEIGAFPRLKESGYPGKKLKLRFFRRVTGAGIIATVAVLLFWGLNFMPKPSIDMFHQQAAHWALVMILVFVVILLAIWDTLESLRYLETLADQVSRKDLEDLEAISRHLQLNNNSKHRESAGNRQ